MFNDYNYPLYVSEPIIIPYKSFPRETMWTKAWQTCSMTRLRITLFAIFVGKGSKLSDGC
jgi:hypothetical protein